MVIASGLGIVETLEELRPGEAQQINVTVINRGEKDVYSIRENNDRNPIRS
jgi:hypothetical protein